MCMKYVNATLDLFRDIEIYENSATVFKYPVVKIPVALKDGKFVFDKFFVLTNINIIGTKDVEEQKNHILYSDKTLTVKIRLTRCSEELEKRNFIDLDTFNLSFDKSNTDMACYRYHNSSKILPVNELPLPSLGKYVIKVLVSNKENPVLDKDFSIQSMRSVEFVNVE